MNIFGLIVVVSYFLSAAFITFVILSSPEFFDGHEPDFIFGCLIVGFVPIVNTAIIICAIVDAWMELCRRK